MKRLQATCAPRAAKATVGVLTLVALTLNFSARTGDWGSDRVMKETPDQMYEPTYPDVASSFGVIYAANGPFLVRAIQSALALGDGANATIFSDANGTRTCSALVRRLSSGVRCVQADQAGWGFRAAKLWAFTASPYDKTLYIDADAFPCVPYAWLKKELSPALERYDVMAAHSSFRDGFPHALHWLNAGVIAFDTRSPAATAVFGRWLETYLAAARGQTGPVTDQRLFNEAVLFSPGLRPMALPPEFNCKSNYKSVRYEWTKPLSPAFYRKVRKNYACCRVPSIGDCVIDHECQFPRHDALHAAADKLRRRDKRLPGRSSQWA